MITSDEGNNNDGDNNDYHPNACQIPQWTNPSKPPRVPHLEDYLSSAEIISMYRGISKFSWTYLLSVETLWSFKQSRPPLKYMRMCMQMHIYAYWVCIFMCCTYKMKIAPPHILFHLSFRENVSGRYFHHNFIYKEANVQRVLKVFQGVQR